MFIGPLRIRGWIRLDLGLSGSARIYGRIRQDLRTDPPRSEDGFAWIRRPSTNHALQGLYLLRTGQQFGPCGRQSQLLHTNVLPPLHPFVKKLPLLPHPSSLPCTRLPLCRLHARSCICTCCPPSAMPHFLPPSLLRCRWLVRSCICACCPHPHPHTSSLPPPLQVAHEKLHLQSLPPPPSPHFLPPSCPRCRSHTRSCICTCWTLRGMPHQTVSP